MDLPARIPILGNNPVFVLEARRIWGRPGIPIFLLLFVALPGLSGMLVWQDHAIDAGWISQALLPFVPASPAIRLTNDLLTDITPIAEGYVVGCMVASWMLAAFWIPGAMAGSASHEREQGLLDDMIAAGVPAATILWGRMWAAPLPLATLCVPVALWAGAPSEAGEISWSLATFFVVCSLGAPFTAGLTSIAVSAVVKRKLTALPVAYCIACAVVLSPGALLLMAQERSCWWGEIGNLVLLTTASYALISLIALRTALRALIRLGATP